MLILAKIHVSVGERDEDGCVVGDKDGLPNGAPDDDGDVDGGTLKLSVEDGANDGGRDGNHEALGGRDADCDLDEDPRSGMKRAPPTASALAGAVRSPRNQTSTPRCCWRPAGSGQRLNSCRSTGPAQAARRL